MPGYSSPPNPIAFKNLVWNLVRQIPPGRVASYGQIANFIPPPPGVDPPDYLAFGARWVGSAMASCPEDVPWQRVINSQGKISLANPEAAQHQRQLLEEEGVIFDERSRVDFTKYRWEGPIP
jgi:methylated-DNA-protein-cysteine methyltransferase related protein